MTIAMQSGTRPSVGKYLKNNMRQYGMLLALVAIIAFFQVLVG